MLIWNVTDSALKAAKTAGLYFKYGDEVPEDEIGSSERRDAMIKRGWLVVKKDRPKAADKKPPLPGPTQRPPEPNLKAAPKAAKKVKKRGR